MKKRATHLAALLSLFLSSQAIAIDRAFCTALSAKVAKAPIEFFLKEQWTIADTRALLTDPSGQINPALIAALTEGYNGIFTRAGLHAPERGRFPINGLACCGKKNEMHRVEGLPAEHLKQIDAVVNEVLRVAREATGEDLVATSVTVGRGFRAGGSDPLIHSDQIGTYIHALVGLQGPTSLVFPEGRNLAEHVILGQNPSTGNLIVTKQGDREGAKKFETKEGFQPGLGETVIITGTDYTLAGTGRKSTLHSSPPSDLERLTLFIDIKPRKKKEP